MRRWIAATLFALVPLLMGPECGLAIEDKEVGEPCTRDDECRPELLCIAGACAVPSDAGAPDSGPADAARVL